MTSRLFDPSTFDLPEEQQKNYFKTDASEIEDVYDSAGADVLTDRPTSSVLGFDPFPAPDEPQETMNHGTSKPQGPHSHKEPALPTELSANGRIMLRKYFAQNTPIELPRGHTTVAFSEPQSHAIVEIISDETVRSSLHSMRSLVLQAVHGGKGQTAGQLRKALIRGCTPDRGMTASSEGESDCEGYTTDGNTSGAYAIDDNMGGASMSQEVDTDSSTPVAKLCAASRGTGGGSFSGQTTVPSPGYSEDDYEPLCTICPQAKHQQVNLSPPRKRRPGKVMKPAYFKGIQGLRCSLPARWTLTLCTTSTSSTAIHAKPMYPFSLKERGRSSAITSPRTISGRTNAGGMNTWEDSIKSQAPLFMLSEGRTGTYFPRSSWER